MSVLIKDQSEQLIQNRLAVIRRRMRLEDFFQRLAFYSFWGLALVGVLLILNRFIRLPIPVSVVVSIPLGVSIITAVCFSLSQKIDGFAAARFVEKRLDLKERLSTALESFRQNMTDDFACLQIRDAANFAKEIVPENVLPYTRPSILKWFPVSVLLIGCAFVVPRMYELPAPPTAAEQAAIDNTAAELERSAMGFDGALAEQIQATAKALRKTTDTQTAQDRLSQLRDHARARNDELLQANETIAELAQASQHFKGMDAAKMAEELEKLAEQPELSPELQAELQNLFKKLAEQLGDNPAARNLMDGLASLQTQAVSPETLKQLARALSKMNQTAKSLAQLEQQIKESRKNIALAEIEMNRESGGGSTPGGGPGEEPGREMEQQLNTSSTPSVPTEGTDLTLTGIPSDSDKFSQVFVGESDPNSETEPAYLPYSDVLLKAQKAYAEAKKNDRIPVQYRKQVEDYLRAIVNP